jgi:hypothetical protein
MVLLARLLCCWRKESTGRFFIGHLGKREHSYRITVAGEKRAQGGRLLKSFFLKIFKDLF